MEGIQANYEKTQFNGYMDKAVKTNAISGSEAGFIVTLVEKFRQDLDRKYRQLAHIQGEINQLTENEKTVVALLDNMARAAERDLARQENARKLRESLENTTSIEQSEVKIIQDKPIVNDQDEIVVRKKYVSTKKDKVSGKK